MNGCFSFNIGQITPNLWILYIVNLSFLFLTLWSCVVYFIINRLVPSSILLDIRQLPMGHTIILNYGTIQEKGLSRILHVAHLTWVTYKTILYPLDLTLGWQCIFLCLPIENHVLHFAWINAKGLLKSLGDVNVQFFQTSLMYVFSLRRQLIFRLIFFSKICDSCCNVSEKALLEQLGFWGEKEHITGLFSLKCLNYYWQFLMSYMEIHNLLLCVLFLQMLMKHTDRWGWSSKNGKQHLPKESFQLPSVEWIWESDWYIDHGIEVDNEVFCQTEILN